MSVYDIRTLFASRTCRQLNAVDRRRMLNDTSHCGLNSYVGLHAAYNSSPLHIASASAAFSSLTSARRCVHDGGCAGDQTHSLHIGLRSSSCCCSWLSQSVQQQSSSVKQLQSSRAQSILLSRIR